MAPFFSHTQSVGFTEQGIVIIHLVVSVEYRLATGQTGMRQQLIPRVKREKQYCLSLRNGSETGRVSILGLCSVCCTPERCIKNKFVVLLTRYKSTTF